MSSVASLKLFQVPTVKLERAISLILIFSELYKRCLIYCFLLVSQVSVQMTCFGIYVVIMIGLYICPIFIRSPCISPRENLPTKPLVTAHKGASAVGLNRRHLKLSLMCLAFAKCCRHQLLFLHRGL